MPKTTNSKRSIIIGIMEANKNKSMDDVVDLIAKSKDFKHHAKALEEARYYYGKFVRTGVAPGVLIRKTKTKAARKSKEVPAAKLLKDVGLSPATKKKLVTAKSDEEIAAIKAANLAKLKAVSAKQKKYNQIARPDGAGVDGFDADVARAEVAELLEDDSFAAPKFLSKSQVKALV